MTLEDRQKSEEARFKHDQELAFKARNRRNKLFGLWLAETYLGKTGQEAMDYAKDMVMADFERPGDGSVIDKAKEDLAAIKVELSEHLLYKHLAECEALAKQQVMVE